MKITKGNAKTNKSHKGEKHMEKINNYWVDENNNRWNASNNTEKQAQEKSESLINCRDCSNKIDFIDDKPIGGRAISELQMIAAAKKQIKEEEVL